MLTKVIPIRNFEGKNSSLLVKDETELFKKKKLPSENSHSHTESNSAVQPKLPDDPVENKFKERFGVSNLTGNFASPGYGKPGKPQSGQEKSSGQQAADKSLKIESILDNMKNSFVGKSSSGNYNKTLNKSRGLNMSYKDAEQDQSYEIQKVEPVESNYAKASK